MSQRLIKSWPLLVVCGVCYALFAVIIFLISPAGGMAPSTAGNGRSIMEMMGGLAMAAGACTVASGLRNATRRTAWLLVLNGLACGALGTMMIVAMRRPVAFRTIALFIVAMAVSIGWYELVAARRLRAHLADEWLLAGAGVISVGFAAVFFGFIVGWIRLAPSPSGQTFYWISAYFAFSAICMLGLALGELRPPASIHDVSANPLPIA